MQIFRKWQILLKLSSTLPRQRAGVYTFTIRSWIKLPFKDLFALKYIKQVYNGLQLWFQKWQWMTMELLVLLLKGLRSLNRMLNNGKEHDLITCNEWFHTPLMSEPRKLWFHSDCEKLQSLYKRSHITFHVLALKTFYIHIQT